MGCELNGFRCDNCKAEWNLLCLEDTLPEPTCPNCTSDSTTLLSQTVPFSKDSGLGPDFIYHCICGKLFQKSPVKFNPHEDNPEKVRKQNTTVCIYCKRSNHIPLGWYIP